MNKRINEQEAAWRCYCRKRGINKAGVVQNNNLQQSQSRGASADPAINDADSASEAENKRLSASYRLIKINGFVE
ncbi:hypothetical protein MJ579_05255 [Klebsiella pneumoniae]|nr:hypothetical protein MJ579_05255 [Klebsiella pneumoniae]